MPAARRASTGSFMRRRAPGDPDVDTPPDLLLVGASTRALAASVRRSGFRGALSALDLFGDLDQEILCRSLVPGRDVPGGRNVASLLRAAILLRPQAVMFSGGMENHPRLLYRLERRTTILGNSARSVRLVRDPSRFFRCLDAARIPHPRTWIESRAGRRIPDEARALARAGRLLWKPRLGGGGVRIRAVTAAGGAVLGVGENPGGRADGGARAVVSRGGRGPARGAPGIPRGGYLQERVDGIPASVSFVADGRRCRILGYCQGLAGEPGLGAGGFLYAGNLWGPPAAWLPAAARETLARAARHLTREFGLRGLNGIDFILAQGRPLLLEVNPRCTASMELIEEGWGRSLFAVHRQACLRGRLPAPPGAEDEGVPASGWLGKGILYAGERLRVGDAVPFRRAQARDIPRPGSVVEAGWPLCTVVARAAGTEACRRILLERAAGLRRLLAAGARRRRASC